MRVGSIVKLLSVGAIALVMAGCGGGGGNSTATVPAEDTGGVEIVNGLPMGESGNYLLLPGYEYDVKKGGIYEMNILEPGGKVLFSGRGCSYRAFDINFNDYSLGTKGYLGDNGMSNGNAYEFIPGRYYVSVYSCAPAINPKTLSVASDVL